MSVDIYPVKNPPSGAPGSIIPVGRAWEVSATGLLCARGMSRCHTWHVDTVAQSSPVLISFVTMRFFGQLGYLVSRSKVCVVHGSSVYIGTQIV